MPSGPRHTTFRVERFCQIQHEQHVGSDGIFLQCFLTSKISLISSDDVFIDSWEKWEVCLSPQLWRLNFGDQDKLLTSGLQRPQYAALPSQETPSASASSKAAKILKFALPPAVIHLQLFVYPLPPSITPSPRLPSPPIHYNCTAKPTDVAQLSAEFRMKF
ncbi:hypothetical protein Y032_0717g1790 [Ancylostoma ceylanicum]|uniref:Uncharacterized protein n=1 Tax=Ancylostoma ceylanicum TaxID=53326 RepID=A0A016WFL3_9BILA|nr:hypothetical protein Y032_0717g1790 [Ancylostoma ceylanicum]